MFPPAAPPSGGLKLPSGMTIEQFIAKGARAYGVTLGQPQN